MPSVEASKVASPLLFFESRRDSPAERELEDESCLSLGVERIARCVERRKRARACAWQRAKRVHAHRPEGERRIRTESPSQLCHRHMPWQQTFIGM